MLPPFAMPSDRLPNSKPVMKDLVCDRTTDGALISAKKVNKTLNFLITFLHSSNARTVSRSLVRLCLLRSGLGDNQFGGVRTNSAFKEGIGLKGDVCRND